jgi:hypothetical protein
VSAPREPQSGSAPYAAVECPCLLTDEDAIAEWRIQEAQSSILTSGIPIYTKNGGVRVFKAGPMIHGEGEPRGPRFRMGALGMGA